MRRGLFIVFEGIDGSGKTTQAIKFANYLFSKNKYKNVLLTREPYEDKKIREILHLEENPYSKAELLSKLFVEDRKKHLKKVIWPALKRNIDVVCDRYSLSTLAYQQAQGVQLKKLLKMHKGLLIPDIIFLIDISSEVAMKRMGNDLKRGVEQKFEKEKSFIEKVRRNYFFLANLDKHRVFVINGEKNIEKVFKEVVFWFEKFERSSYNQTF
ncbi:MAG: dTMP kinase [Candidatus Pacearchaeota archaeon]